VLALRLPEPEKSEFIRCFNATLHQAYGVVQKEYVSVPAETLADTASLTPCLAAAWRYVHTLKSKPTQRGGGG
jgi:hypothetical protein